jgi:uncharacterized protein (TIGR02246 family)
MRSATRALGGTMNRKLLLLVAAAVLLPACQNRSNETTKLPTTAVGDEKPIRASIDRWLTLIPERDAAGIAEIYAKDAVMMPPNRPIVVGREAIHQYWETAISTPEMTLTFDPGRIEFSRSGDIAIDRGTYVYTGKIGGKTLEERGKYVIVWKKVGDDWKVASDIWNADAPTKGA